MYESKGEILRVKSVPYIIGEIRNVAKKYPVAFVKFHDDIFGNDAEWLKEFSDRYPKEIGLPFVCYARPNIVSESYAGALKKSGCHCVTLAVECGNERLRNLVLNRSMNDAEILRACEILRRHDIKIYTLNMVGLPGEAEKEMMETVKLNQKIKPTFAETSIFQPYPGTAITEYCKKNGYLDEKIDSFASPYTVSMLNFKPALKLRIEVISRFFSILIDHPQACRLLKPLFLLYRFPSFKIIVNLLYRIYYGYNLHARVYGSKIPFFVRIRGAYLLIKSRNRV